MKYQHMELPHSSSEELNGDQKFATFAYGVAVDS
jgi:hypothetical protein